MTKGVMMMSQNEVERVRVIQRTLETRGYQATVARPAAPDALAPALRALVLGSCSRSTAGGRPPPPPHDWFEGRGYRLRGAPVTAMAS